MYFIFIAILLQSVYPATKHALFDAIYSKNESVVEHLLNKNPNLIHEKYEVSKNSPLHVAASKNFCPVIERLVKAGADIEAKTACYRKTPLHCATCENCYEAAKLLIHFKANIEAKDCEGQTPLHMAAWKRDALALKIAELLLVAGANIESEDKKGHTPLFIAVWAYNCKMTELFIQNGANIETRGFSYFQPPLHLAVRWGLEEILELLLKARADIEAQDDIGWTPLHHNVGNPKSEEQIRILLALLQAGANIHAKNKRGVTPLDYAKEWKDVEIIEILEKHAAPAETKKDLTERRLTLKESKLS